MRDWVLSALAVCLSAVVVLLVLFGRPAISQDWQVRELGSVSPSVFAEPCRPMRGGLPDGCVASGRGDITSAWYTRPTERYAHAILGDGIEGGGLRVRDANGREFELVLPTSAVFEDRTPRLADLDRDGRTEVITIRSSVRVGGSVAVYGVRNGELRELGATPFIGRTNRWLNIAGIADFLGRGDLQIAFVETPHIGGTLKLATFDGSRVQVVARQGGFSNHAIGAREQRLAVAADMNGDGAVDLLLPDSRRQRLFAVTFRPALSTLHDFDTLGGFASLIGDGSGNAQRALALTLDGRILQISW